MLNQILEYASRHAGEQLQDDSTGLVMAVEEMSAIGQSDSSAGQ
jgi:hypothetical protein